MKRRFFILVFLAVFITGKHDSYAYYNPSTGRWLSRDPIGERGGVNLYSFCVNNPVDFFDSDGGWPKSPGCIAALKEYEMASEKAKKTCKEAAEKHTRAVSCAQAAFMAGECCPKGGTSLAIVNACCEAPSCKTICDDWHTQETACNRAAGLVFLAYLNVIRACVFRIP